MAKQILFRGKADTDITNLDDLGIPHENGWVRGTPVFKNRTCYIIYGIEDVCEEYFSPRYWVKIIPESVGQYTGHLDVTAERIFEGDIVEEMLLDEVEPEGFYFCRSVVEMVNGCWVLSQVGFDYSNTPLSERTFLYEAEKLELVGNIHDNPELLGKEVTSV